MLYTILDIESTGFHKEGGDEILSFGFIRCNSQFEIKASGVLYFYKPGFNVEKCPAFNTHKLKLSFMQEHENKFNDNLKKMYSLCYNSVIVGKNSTKFDMPFIKNFCKRHAPLLDELTYLKTFDVQEEFCKIYREKTKNNNVGTLTDYVNCLGITKQDLENVYNSLPVKDSENMHMHGALFDTVATYMVFKENCKILNLRP